MAFVKGVHHCWKVWDTNNELKRLKTEHLNALNDYDRKREAVNSYKSKKRTAEASIEYDQLMFMRNAGNQAYKRTMELSNLEAFETDAKAKYNEIGTERIELESTNYFNSSGPTITFTIFGIDAILLSKAFIKYLIFRHKELYETR